MTIVRPTVKDVARAVAQLNDDPNEESISRVVDNLAFVVGRNVKLRKITQRDAALMLAAAGADDFILGNYARIVAARLRACSDSHGGLSAYI